jgi:hypothetical protein
MLVSSMVDPLISADMENHTHRHSCPGLGHDREVSVKPARDFILQESACASQLSQKSVGSLVPHRRPGQSRRFPFLLLSIADHFKHKLFTA